MDFIDINTRLSDVEIVVNLNGKPETVPLFQDLVLDPDDLNTAYIDQPAKYAWWCVMCNYARLRVDKLKNELTAKQEHQSKTLKAQLDRRVRQELEDNGEKVTEGKVEMAIYASAEYQASQQAISKLRDELIEAEHEYSMLQTAVSAMNQRKDMLISLGANIRAEWENSGINGVKMGESSEGYSHTTNRNRTTTAITSDEMNDEVAKVIAENKSKKVVKTARL